MTTWTPTQKRNFKVLTGALVFLAVCAMIVATHLSISALMMSDISAVHERSAFGKALMYMTSALTLWVISGTSFFLSHKTYKHATQSPLLHG